MKGLSPTAQTALVHLVERGEMPVGWKNTPYIIASGTADALETRGYARSVGMMLSGTFRIAPTDLGREFARLISAVGSASTENGGAGANPSPDSPLIGPDHPFSFLDQDTPMSVGTESPDSPPCSR